MRCPFCRNEDTHVVDTRLISDGDSVRRRRGCRACGERWTTFETAELLMPKVVKRDGARAPFDDAKLRAGMGKALERRPVAEEEVEAAIGRIMQQIRRLGEREVAASQIGEWVMTELRQLDAVAYVRFASVYRDFQDVAEFRSEIQRLESDAP